MPQTILLVDGDVAVRNDALRNAGFEILETSNGAEALKLASECQPTLIVLAIELSGADGFAICKLLKSNPLTASIPVLHLSNAQSDCGYLESAESGAEGYLQEPVQPSVLVGVVKALIHARSVRATMRKAEQEGLAKDSLAALIATIPDEVWFANEQGRLALANPSALREFKMGPPNTVLVEELAESLKVLRADGTPRPAEEAPLLRALGGETVRNQEEIVRTPIHGELRYRQVSASPVRDAVGSIVGSVSVVRDVTSQKLAEQALRASEERLRLFVEYAPAAIAILDRQMRYVAFSRRWLEDYLPGEQDLTGRSHYDVFPELPERWKEIHRRCLAGAVEKCDEDTFPRLDGKLDWVRWEIHPWRNEKGEIEGITIFSEVITERKRAEAALRESEDQFRTLANAIPQLCWMAKADGWIFWYNERWYAYTGTTPEQMEGWGWQSVHDSAALPKVLDRWQASIATGKPFDMVFPLRGTDGEFRPFLTRVMPVRDQDGSVVSWFGTNTDISEQRRTEQALATSESRLRALLESAAQGVVAVDETGRILLVNARTEELFGYSRDEVIGQPLDLLVPEHLQASHAVHQREYFANPRTRQMGAGLDLQGRKKDGGDISVEISLSFVEEGGNDWRWPS